MRAALVKLLLCLLFVLQSCSSSSGPDGDDDGQAPAPILDLAVAAFTVDSVTLTWTAPGDDGDVGTAARYEVRGSLDFIHPGTWTDATVAPNPPTPGPAGTVETMTITGLEEDERYFFAVTAFDRAGNSPGCSNCVEVVCLDNTAVVFADAAVEAAVRAALGVPDGPLLRATVRQLVDLQVEDQGVVDLGGLEECLGLSFLRLRSNAIADLSPLAGLTSLGDLDLADNAVVDLAPLVGLVNLRHLHLDDNSVVDLEPLAGLVRLEILNLARNQIADLTPLSDLTALLSLRLDGNIISDLGPLAALVALTDLSLPHNAAADLGPLSQMAALQALVVTSNGIAELAPLAGLGQLQFVVAGHNLIGDLQPLVDNAGIGAGDIVYVHANPLSSTAITVQIPALQARGVTVYH